MSDCQAHAADCSCADCVDIRAMRSSFMAVKAKKIERTCEECGGDVGGYHFTGCSKKVKRG